MKKCRLVSIIPADKLFAIGKFIEDNGGVIDDYSPYTNSKASRKSSRMRTEKEDKEVRKWYKDNPHDPIPALGKRFNFSVGTIRRILELR